MPQPHRSSDSAWLWLRWCPAQISFVYTTSNQHHPATLTGESSENYPPTKGAAQKELRQKNPENGMALRYQSDHTLYPTERFLLRQIVWSIHKPVSKGEGRGQRCGVGKPKEHTNNRDCRLCTCSSLFVASRGVQNWTIRFHKNTQNPLGREESSSPQVSPKDEQGRPVRWGEKLHKQLTTAGNLELCVPANCVVSKGSKFPSLRQCRAKRRPTFKICRAAFWSVIEARAISGIGSRGGTDDESGPATHIVSSPACEAPFKCKMFIVSKSKSLCTSQVIWRTKPHTQDSSELMKIADSREQGTDRTEHICQSPVVE